MTVLRRGVGVQSSEERHAGRFLLALGETGTGGGDAGRRVHLVRAHCGSGIGVRCDHLDVATLPTQGLDLALESMPHSGGLRRPSNWPSGNVPLRPPNGESTTTRA
jgi:hypothetical protein